jgi:UDP-N-acetylmuramoyl-L-alanyl-D-glutamate--2,6-diaminopimelate ligase
LTIIGVTGTDGKTTTVAMTAHILHEAGIRVGAVSTSFFRIGGTIENNPTHKTSLTPSELQRFLKRCVREGCTTVVVEASSHGLVQHRVDFLWPKVAAITNTSPEHLDYHGTMEQYRKDKGILFRMLRPNGIAVLNADDETHALYRTIPAGWRIDYSSTKSLVASHSANECAFSAKNIHEAHGEVSAHVRCNAEDVEWHLRLPMTGRFNVDNALCAISCAHAVSIPSNIAVHALSSFTGVPGRMERIDEGQNFHVFVDFTVTPGAYEKTLSSVRQMLPLGKRLLVLTGSCGDRMREKRPLIGAICSRLADVVVVTEDETLTEDPLQTIEDVWAGMNQMETEGHKIPDRREAIAFLLRSAKEGDAVVLCGMGACTSMQTREGLRPWDEREVARELLHSRP